MLILHTQTWPLLIHNDDGCTFNPRSTLHVPLAAAGSDVCPCSESCGQGRAAAAGPAGASSAQG